MRSTFPLFMLLACTAAPDDTNDSGGGDADTDADADSDADADADADTDVEPACIDSVDLDRTPTLTSESDPVGMPAEDFVRVDACMGVAGVSGEAISAIQLTVGSDPTVCYASYTLDGAPESGCVACDFAYTLSATLVAEDLGGTPSQCQRAVDFDGMRLGIDLDGSQGEPAVLVGDSWQPLAGTREGITISEVEGETRLEWVWASDHTWD